MGFSILKIGEVARVHLPEFTLETPARKDFRYAIKRIGREGYVFEIIKAQDLPAHMPRLRAISDAWLALKNGEEKSFSVGAFAPDYVQNFDHGVLRHADTGQIMAFATLLQGADKHEMAIDLMRHDPKGPQLMMEALFVELILWAKGQGYQWFNLGAAPFSGFKAMPRRTLWSKFGHLIFEHGAAFYNFGGLRAFKSKFDPEWRPHYLVLPRGVDAPKVLYEVNGLVSGGLKGLL
jgi:phosphatidylglycerol lysyltransferase